MRVFVDTSGRWSGGGSAVLTNLASAAQTWPSVFTTDPSERSVTLIPRNLAHRLALDRRDYIVAPQNAWPWVRTGVLSAERWRVSALLAGSELVIARARALLRISAAVPHRKSGVRCSPVIHNVLDLGFETALTESRSSRTPDIDPRESFLSIGGIYSYRNLPALVVAHGRYRERGGRLGLVIVGPAGSPAALSRLRAVVPPDGSVTVHATALPRHAAMALMRDAAGVILPSLVEASPLTALEAVAVSERVLLSDIPGHRGVLANAGPLDPRAFFDPTDPESLCAGLDRLEAGWSSPLTHLLADAQFRDEERLRWAARLAGWLTRVLAST